MCCLNVAEIYANFSQIIHQNMGNCCERCFGRLDKRKYLRTRYNVERDISIEFENLMDEETQEEEMNRVVNERERHLVSRGQFEQLINEQKRIDAEIDAELIKQEEELRMEEEAYYEAKREAARVAKLQKQRELASKNKTSTQNGPNSWLGDDDSEWDVAGGEDDFEMFLESVKARSLAARTRAIASQVPVDAQSTSSSTQTREEQRSRTEASSIDLEWEHEAGMHPPPKEKTKVDEKVLQELVIKPIAKDSPIHSHDLEWDSNDDFVNSDLEKETLLSKKSDDEQDR